MLKKTLLAILCSTALVACGGGSSDGDSKKDDPKVEIPANDLDKAKQLVTTTNNIISYFQDFEKLGTTYKPTFDAIGDTGSDIGNATGLVVTLAALAHEDAKGATKTYTAAQLQDLLEEDDYIDYQLSGSNFTVTTTASSVSISGSAKVKYWVGGYWDNVAKEWVDTFGDDATVTVTGMKLEAPFTASASTYNFKIVAGGKIATKNAANKEASFSFNSDSTAQAVYATAAKLESRNSDERPKTAEFKLSNLEFASNGVVMTLGEFSSKAQSVSIKDKDETKAELIPTEITFKGQTKVTGASDNLAFEASVKLDPKLDLTKTIDVTGDKFANSLVNSQLAMKLSGNVKDGKGVNKAFSADFAATSAELKKGTATVDIAVAADKLKVAFATADFTVEEPTVSATISHANGAKVEIPNVEKFTSADIKVGTTTHGTITKVSQSLYQAKFTDNVVVPIAP